MTKRISIYCAVILGLVSMASAWSSPKDISLTSVASAANGDGRAEVLAIGQDGNLYQRWQAASGWSLWNRLATGKFTDAALIRATDGRLYAFGIDTGQLVVLSQTTINGGWATQGYRTGDGLQRLSVTLDNSGHFVVTAIKGGSLWVIKGLGDQALVDNNWTDWTLLGGDELASVSAARDGDGRVVIATLTKNAQLQIVRQISASDDRWSRWQALSGGKDGDLTVALSQDRGLWLFNTGLKQGLSGRMLGATTAASPPSNPLAQIDTGPPARTDPKATRPPKNNGGGVTSKGLDLLPLNDAWSNPIAQIDQPLYPIEGIAAQRSASGAFDMFAAGMQFVQKDNLPANRVVWFTGASDGNWPSSSEVLPASAQTSILSRLAISRGNGSDSLFALDRGTGRVFVLTRSGTSQWRDGAWFRLGQVPGPTSPDLAFQATACLESISKTPDDAAKLRTQISSGVTDNLKSALAGTLVGDLANDVNGLSICTPHGEALGVWLDGEANPDALLQNSIVPTGNAFAVLLPEATLRRAVDEIWTKMPKHQTFEGKAVRTSDQDIELSSYRFTLEAPDTLILDIFGRAPAYSLDVRGEVRARFFSQDGAAGCIVSTSADVDPPWLRKLIEGIATGFFMSLVDDKLNDLFGSGGKGQAAQLCTVSAAFISELYLPVPDNPSRTPQILEIRYSGMHVQTGTGILGFGTDIPTVRDRVPSAKLTFTPVVAGKDRLLVRFQVASTDIKSPPTINWLPSDPQKATRVLGPADLKRDITHDTTSEFEYAVEPSNVARWYQLGAMTVEVKGADGLEMDDTQTVDVFIRPR